MANAAANRRAIGLVSEMSRVLALPRRVVAEAAAQPLVEKHTARHRRRRDARPLRPIQACLLEEAEAAAQHPALGLLGSIGVGAGKSLAFMLFPEVFDAKRPVLLIPPDMVDQTQRDRWEWGQHYRFRDVTIVPYSMLSQADSTDLLRRLEPDLIMADEAHNLRYEDAARTKRFLRYMEERPETRFVGMSGTLTGNSLKDFAHLARLALGNRSPLPLEERDLKAWCGVLDAGAEGATADWSTLLALVRWADPTSTWTPPHGGAATLADLEVVREAFNTRLATAPGVVCTTSPSCDARLTLTGRYDAPLGEVAQDALRRLHQEYVLPDGTEVVDARHFHRAAGQLSLGFYYKWAWEGEPDYEWLEARNGWASACRWYLKRYSREGCDSPFLVEEYVRSSLASRRQVSPELTQALVAWDEQRSKPPPPVTPVWLDYGVVAWAAKWALERPAGFVWYGSRAVGEMLGKFGLPVFGADCPDPKYNETPRAALSIAVYNKGRNFQAWNDQLFLEVPRSATLFEQALGRQHRQGQKAEEVRADLALHAWPAQYGLSKAIEKSRYIQATTGQPQRLVFADKVGIRQVEAHDDPYKEI